MEDLHVMEIRALADVGGQMLEVRGDVVVRRGRRLSDYGNHPDPMLDIDRAAIRYLGAESSEPWEEVEGLSLNRDRVLLLLPAGAAHVPSPNPDLQVPGRKVRVKVICRGLEVTGFVQVPLHATISAFIHETRTRFLSVSQARVVATKGGARIDDLGDFHPFCLVNREYVIACIETKVATMPNIDEASS